MFNPNDLLGMLNNIKENIDGLEEKQASEIFSAKSGGGLVSVSVNGKGEVVDLMIDKTLLDDVDSLQILIMSAVNEAYKNMETSRKNSAMGLFNDLSAFKK